MKSFIKSIPLFSALSDADIQFMIDNGLVKEYVKGETIHSPDEICNYVSIVLEGKLYSTKYSLSGKEQIVCNLVAGKCFGYPVVFGNLTYPEYIITETQSKVLYVHRDILMSLFDNKDFLLLFFEALSKKIKDFSELVEILSYTSVKERVARYLLNQVQESKPDNISLKVNKTRLAKELGSVRVVVSRVFKTLEEEGIIEQPNDQEVMIIDKNKLENFS